MQRVGHYVVERELGAGGMGVVYLGRTVAGSGRAETPVAIKTMASHLFADPKQRAQFIREARIALRVRHPNVVATLDMIELDGKVWHVMEFVDGLSLHAVMREAFERERPIPTSIALRVLADLLHGIGGAYHATGADGTPLWIVHRDVSPQNVIISRRDGVARVLDFGIAKTATHQTATGEDGFRGKIRYVAPEQIKGQPVSHQSDIYSAGVVGWEMLGGRALFQGETMAVTATRVLLGHVPSLLELNDSVSEELDQCIRSMVAGELSVRPEDARELASRIETMGPLASREELATYIADWMEEVTSEKPHPAGVPNKPRDLDTVSEPFAAPRVHAATAMPSRTVLLQPMDKALDGVAGMRSAADTTNAPLGALRPQRRIVGALTLGVLAIVLLGAVFSVRTVWGDRRVGANPASSVAGDPTAPPLVVPSSSIGVIAASEPSSAPPRATAEGSASPPSIASTSSRPAASNPSVAVASGRGSKVSPRHTASAPAKPPAPTAPDCRTPTYLDEKGIQRIRPECFKPQ